MSKRLSYLFTVLAILGILAIAYAFTGPANTIFKQFKLLESVFSTINRDYVDPVDYRKLIKGAIDGITSTLDPHTVFMIPKHLSDLDIETKGKFGGLGIQISIRNNWLTVIAPMEGTPAFRKGIHAGDQIVKIEGESTWGITTDQAILKLRGEPGTDVTITIEREGEPEPFDVTITRDIIVINPVPFYGVTESNIGYIRLSQFSELATSQLKEGLQKLRSKKTKGIILDLRGNSGGLLQQAIAVSNLFLQENSLVVYTQGKSEFETRQFYTENNGIYRNGPLIVLVNVGSASASEIVAGAIQDHDRGLVLGTTTFGKGLVQSVRRLPQGAALKISTAKYYIPSGRCIQREDYLKNPKSAIITSTEAVDLDTLDPWNWLIKPEPPDTDSTGVNEKPVFYTESGRIVYGGGGITPDIHFENPIIKRIEAALERKAFFFDFVVKYTAKHEKLFNSPKFEVTDDIINDFREFLKEKKFTYKSRAEELAETLDSIAVLDSFTESTMLAYNNFCEQIEHEKEQEFNRSIPYIKRGIKREIVRNLFGEKELYRQIVLKTDPAVLKAVEILLNNEEYNEYFLVNENK